MKVEKKAKFSMSHVVIFDFDGTIADTFDVILQLFNEVAPDFNLPRIKDSEKEEIRNFSAKELVKRYRLTPWKLLRLVQRIHSKIRRNIQDIPIVKGMDRVFRDLNKQGITVGVVTSNSTENVQLFLNKCKITTVDFIHSEHNIFGKGKVLAHLIKEKKLSKEDVVYVGDEVRDIEAAQKAGVAVIAVNWGFNSEKRLRRAGPDYVVSESKEILGKLRGLEDKSQKLKRLQKLKGVWKKRQDVQDSLTFAKDLRERVSFRNSRSP